LSEQNAAALEVQARAAYLPPESYLSKIVAGALHSQHTGEVPEHFAGQLLKPKKSAYGLLAKYGPGPPEEELRRVRPVIAGVADTHAALRYLLRNPSLSV
jgi:hypothetical protein